LPLSSEERYYLKLKAAHLYYKENKTQTEIAELFNLSRPTVIKLLSDARDEGIVTIEVRDIRMGGRHYVELEQELLKRLSLTDIKIVGVGNKTQLAINSSIGLAASNYFTSLLRPGMKVGIGWGYTLETMSNYITPNHTIPNLSFIPLLGGISNASSNDYTISANALCETIAHNYADSSVSMLYAPLVAQNMDIVHTITQSADVSGLLGQMGMLDIAMIGIDGEPTHSTTVTLEKALNQISEEIIEKECAGNVCLRFYDIRGNIQPLSIEDLIIGVTVENLRNTPVVLGAAGGPYKAGSIIGAARARLFNRLVTDEYTAFDMLNTLKSEEKNNGV
jgi:DNA-binding transcriptional regulator LsrR (DeoR family)